MCYSVTYNLIYIRKYNGSFIEGRKAKVQGIAPFPLQTFPNKGNEREEQRGGRQARRQKVLMFKEKNTEGLRKLNLQIELRGEILHRILWVVQWSGYQGNGPLLTATSRSESPHTHP